MPGQVSRTDKTIDRLRAVIAALAGDIDRLAVQALPEGAEDRIALCEAITSAAEDIDSAAKTCAAISRRAGIR
jgi:hypothetical protein